MICLHVRTHQRNIPRTGEKGMGSLLSQAVLLVSSPFTATTCMKQPHAKSKIYCLIPFACDGVRRPKLHAPTDTYSNSETRAMETHMRSTRRIVVRRSHTCSSKRALPTCIGPLRQAAVCISSHEQYQYASTDHCVPRRNSADVFCAPA